MTADFTTRITEILRDNIPIRRSDCKLGVSDLVLKVTAHELAEAAEQHYRPFSVCRRCGLISNRKVLT